MIIKYCDWCRARISEDQKELFTCEERTIDYNHEVLCYKCWNKIMSLKKEIKKI